MSAPVPTLALVNGDADVRLTWSNPAVTEAGDVPPCSTAYRTSYSIERRPVGGSWTQVASGVSAAATTWDDVAPPDGEYEYRLRSYERYWWSDL